MKRARRDDQQLKDGRTLPIFIHSTIDDMTELSPNTMRVYMHLARRANKTGSAWPSYQSIGDHCFVSVYKHADTRRRHAVKAVADLIDAGLIRKDGRRDTHGQQSNVYIVLEPVIVESQPAVTQGSQGYVIVESQGVVIPQSQGAVIVGSPEDTPIKNTPFEGGVSSSFSAPVASPKIPAPATRNGDASLSEKWAACTAELTAAHPRFADWLPGSTLTSTDALRDGKPILRLAVVNPRGLEWLETMRDGIRRKLGSVLGKRILIEIVAATPQEDCTP